MASSESSYVWSFLHKTLGLNDVQSAGVMGNMQRESGVTSKKLEGDYALRPNYATVSDQAALDAYTSNRLFNLYANSGISINKKGYMKDGHYYPGLGLSQWTGVRSQRLMDYASQTGRSWTDLSTQLDYLNYELKTYYPSVLENLKKATTVAEATAAFAPYEHSIIKPGTQEYELRYGYAATLYSELTGIPLEDLPEGLTGLESLFGDFLSESELGMMIDPMEIDCLIAYVPQDVTDIDYGSLSENRVMGVAFYGGDITNGKYNYRSSNIDAQVASALANNFPFAMIVGVYANDQASAKEECDQLYYTLSRYPPGLGLWLDLHTTSTEVLDYYFKRCQYWGLGNACGLYCDLETLNEIGWQNYKDDYFFWVINHFEDDAEMEILDTLLTPEFFAIEG